MCILRAVAPAHRHDETGDDAAVFRFRFGERGGGGVRDQRVGRHEDMGARHEQAFQTNAEFPEEAAKVVEILYGQRREARQRRTPVPVERGRQSPDAAPASVKLALLPLRVFDEGGSVTTA